MRKLKFAFNYLFVVLLIGIIALAPFYVVLFVLEATFSAIFGKKTPNIDENTANIGA